jgi:hypothetical protein
VLTENHSIEISPGWAELSCNVQFLTVRAAMPSTEGADLKDEPGNRQAADD